MDEEALDNVAEETEEKSEEKSEEKPKEKAKEKDEDDEDDEDDEQEEKNRLWELLKNPKTALSTITELAKEAGLLNSEKTDKQVKKGIQDILEEELGDDLKFMGPKLAKAIEKILAGREEAHEERFNEIKKRELQRETNEAVDRIKKDFKDFSLFEKKVIKLMGEMNPSPNLTQYQYLKRLYTIAKAEVTGDKPKEKKSDGVISKLGRTPVGGEHGEKSARPISRRQAISLAMEELSSKED